MKYWVLKNQLGEYLCNVGYYSYDLVATKYGVLNCHLNGSIVYAERKSYLTETMKDFNKDIKPEYKVKPVQVELEIKYIIREIKKEDK